MRSNEIKGPIETIYFGGGTPSVLEEHELNQIMEALHSNFQVNSDAEITFEANPEDINTSSINLWKSNGINRLSIGVQSFSDDILTWMNRSHSALQSKTSVNLAQELGITNISIDLIYGVHSRTLEDWHHEMQQALALNVPHISAYCLTVEEKTVFHKKVEKGEPVSLPDEAVEKEFFALVNTLEEKHISMYEVSNFSKKGQHSIHNSNYWSGKPYLGFGPGAHSFDGSKRSWNVSNNAKYINGIKSDERVFSFEKLGLTELYNEYVMTHLRMKQGIDLDYVNSAFNLNLLSQFSNEIEGFVSQNLLDCSQGIISLTTSGLLMADRIASELFQTTD